MAAGANRATAGGEGRYYAVVPMNEALSNAAGAIIVVVPSRPEFMHVLRAVAASVAGRMDFPYDKVDDLRLAVDEAGSQLLAISDPSSHITMRMDDSPEEVTVSLLLDHPAGTWPPVGPGRTLSWQVLSALTDEAEFGQDGPAPIVSLRKRSGR